MTGFEIPGARTAFEEPGALLLLAALPIFLLLRPLFARESRHSVRHFDLWRRARDEASRRERVALILRRIGTAAAGVSFLAAVLAAAGARLVLPGGGRYALVLDVSASTQARGAGGAPRLERLREEAAEWIAERHSDDRVAVLAAGVEPTWIAGEDPDRGALLDALAQVASEDAPGRPALALAEAVRAGRVPLFFTDGGTEARAAEGWAARFVHADPCSNAGFVGFEIEDDGLRPWVLARFAVRNFGGRPPPLRIEARLGEDRVASIDLAVGPGAEGEGELRVPRRGGGLLRLRLEPGDGFSPDDEVGAFVGKGPGGPVALSRGASGDPVLSAIGGLLAEEAGVALVALEGAARASGSPSLAIAGDEAIDVPLAAGAWLLFGTRLPGVARGETVDRRSLDRVDPSSPLLAGLPLDSLAVAREGAAPPGARSLAGAGGVALLYEATLGSARVIGSTFPLEDSNLPLLPAFPVFARRAFASLAASPRRPLRRTGAPPPGIPLAAWGGEELRRRSGPLPGEAGFANFLDPDESDLSIHLPSGWSGTVPEGPGRRVDPTGALLGIALGGLALRLLAAAGARALEALPP
ncbi:MAG TPA: hypothetical protein VFI25_03485 [Planctomycetota bacterium]|jgi:hypothetical protein|nr:hypothetical protein [Planctomycetota bacterium]